MNMKFGIGVVIAIVLQVSAFVWWTAQQAQTISTKGTMNSYKKVQGHGKSVHQEDKRSILREPSRLLP